MKKVISTDQAPQAIGPYSQAVQNGNLLFMSGQIPLDPATGEAVSGGIEVAVRRVFDNLKAVCEAAGLGLENIVQLRVYLTDLGDFATVNGIMEEYMQPPYPARAAVGVASLPRGVAIEIEATAAFSG